MRLYSKSDTVLKMTEPDQLAAFSNKVLCKEIDVCCPLYSALVRSACNADEKPESSINAIALATSTLVRCRNPKMSALAYSISTILFHSGISYRDSTRLHQLGIGMSPRMVIDLHQKMGGNAQYKAMAWKREIEQNKTALLLLEEVREKQLNRAEDDMVVDVPIDMSKSTLMNYRYFSEDAFNEIESCVSDVKIKMGETIVNEDVLLTVLHTLKGAKLPYYKLVADNVDHHVNARVQTKGDTNRSLHWTHQYAMQEKVANPTKEATRPMKSISELQLIELLPVKDVQDGLVWQWTILVSRMITTYLKPFQPFSSDVIRHIPHEYSKEMEAKSKICYLEMEFHNPNVAAEMAQILKNYQEKYVPSFGGEVLAKVPVHGDQLFEERARNVQWTFRDGEDPYERLEGLETEHADWHAKVTLYKTEFDMFVKDDSAAEIGTSKASINRTGKTNASKGVHNHYNEYKDFHTREVEAHICASFMHMCNMSGMDSQPTVTFPQAGASKEERVSWLIHLCIKHVETYVMGTEIASIVNQTEELARQKSQRYPCRMEGCPKSYVCHGRRVRHEVLEHNLKLQVFLDDERDEIAYYYCRLNCGLVYSTKTIRNRHERQEHNQVVDQQEPEEPITTNNHKQTTNDDIFNSEKEDPNDYLYNYHQKKLSFGLLLLSFEDAVKEGDGQRLFDIYKVTLLLYKATNHPKYAYINLLYLVKIRAILPEFEAERLKWNRFINTGGKGVNIPLDLHKEHQNRVLKTMWRALGPNLNEQNAARIAGTLESMESILTGVDKDCKLSERSSFRSVKKKEEAVHQITKDLVSINAFHYTRCREGHPSFPFIKPNLLSGLDYRDLQNWMKDKLKCWGSIYG